MSLPTLADCCLRAAVDADGPAIGQLFAATGLPDLGVEWSRGIRGWIVAERDGEILGAIQAVPARPYGWIGDVVVAPQAQGRRADGRGRLGRRPGTIGFLLYVAALDFLAEAGAQVALGVTARVALQRTLQHYGAVDLGSVTLLARNLATWRVARLGAME